MLTKEEKKLISCKPINDMRHLHTLSCDEIAEIVTITEQAGKGQLIPALYTAVLKAYQLGYERASKRKA